MNPTKIFPDDPRLTAYALNELEAAERGEFEQVLAQDAAAQETVAEIRAMVASLTGALEHEPMVEPTVKSADATAPFDKIVGFPYWKISGLAAACFAVFFVYWQRNELLREPKQYIEMQLPAASVASKPAVAKMTVADQAAGEVGRVNRDRERDVKAKEVRELAQSLQPEMRAASAPAPMALALPAKGAAGTNVSFGAAQSGPDTGRLEKFAVMGAGTPAVASMDQRESSLTKQPVFVADEHNTEAYSRRRDNSFLRVADNPLSTFSVDVDTASYANVRRFLVAGQRPPADAVRIEELVNYFPYRYVAPQGGAGEVPFAAHLEVAAAPWAPEHRLVRIGLKGRELSDAARPAANLIFLLDVSGSMNQPNKLPLVKQSLRLLVEKLRPDDRVAIAVYAGASGLALPSTSAAKKTTILDAIDRLQAQGSTNGAMGIHLAYDLAKANFIPGGVNRVILATDGDFNVGVTNEGDLTRLIEEKAKSGVFLTVLGFGMGNYKDATLEKLADKGNGNYAYIDTLQEAKKTLVEQAGGTLVTIAKDVKIQVEFNPAQVQAYRLIGYENRLLAKEDFNNDRVDAGEIGAGHTVTALYEVVPVGAAMPEVGSVDALKYQKTAAPRADRDAFAPVARQSTEMLTVKLRYKEPAGDVSRKVEFTLRDTGTAFANASEDFKFAAAVAAFGMVLRDSPYKGTGTLAEVAAWGRDGIGNDAGGYRTEFIELVGQAQHAME